MKNLLASTATGCGLFVCALAFTVACSTTTVPSLELGTEPEADGGSGQPPDSGGEPDASSTPPVPPKDACLTFAEARCEREATCRQNAFVLEYPSKQACVAQKTTACSALLTAPGSTYAKTNAAACAKALPSASCDDMLVGRVPDACRPPPGTFTRDAACAEDAQCGSGVCLLEDQFRCGKCAEKRPAAQLQRCSSSAQCPQGEGCASMSSVVMLNGVCRPLVGEGALCSNAVCAAGNLCVSGVCSASRDLQEECGPFNGPCDSARGLVCDITARPSRCVAPVRKFKLDGACDSTGLCEVGSECKVFSGFGVAACIALPEEGEDCTTRCAPPARCAGSGASRQCEIETPSTCK